ncbi:unnamed protein product [Rhizoctonia solani]|uniref:DRBM domain-containing protein n=1 Tax=Rhizoctonia solani TaxID=456999 RepID=A0A8H3AIW5_9AGAM|nr:unnamed protein product [Rhizoctonia solani]
MPMSINFSEKALKSLMSPPPPAQPLRDLMLTIGSSKDLKVLAMTGRDLLKCCVRSRKFKPPIDADFEVNVDEDISERNLARVARESLLLQRLKVDDVANNPIDVAQIFCAYRMSNIAGLQRMDTPIKPEPALSYASSTRASSTTHFFEDRSNESVSSGRSPPPLSYGAHYQQPFQPYYHTPNATMIPPHMQPPHSLHARFSPYSPGPGGPVHTSSPAALAHPQPQYNVQPPQGIASQTVYPTQPPLGAMPPGGYPAMGIGPNSGFAPPAPGPAPAPVAAPQQTQGFISLINEMAMKNRRSVSWQQAKVGQQHMPEWTMWLFLDGELRGQGTAPTKQAAKELASKAALQALGWIQG